MSVSRQKRSFAADQTNVGFAPKADISAVCKIVLPTFAAVELRGFDFAY
jgi:hypothetical protein